MTRRRYPYRWHALEPAEHHPQCDDADGDGCICDDLHANDDEPWEAA